MLLSVSAWQETKMLLLLALTGLLTGPILGDPGRNIHVEYFNSVTLECNHTDTNDAINVVHFWILPSGDVIRMSDRNQNNETHPHTVLKDNGQRLKIDNVDDGDFGKYYCVFSLESNETDVLEIGVNVNGPYYGPDYYDNLKHNAIVGGISAGATFVVMCSLWIICANCCKRKPMLVDLQDSDSAKNDAGNDDHVKVDMNGTIEPGTTKVQDSVYYMADGINIAPVPVAVESQDIKRSPVLDTNHLDRLSTTDSGHYQSIGSLGRDSYLPSEVEVDRLANSHHPSRSMEPSDIYSRYVKAIHEDSDEKAGTGAEQSGNDDVFETETKSTVSSITEPHASLDDVTEAPDNFSNNYEKGDIASLYAKPMKRSSAYENIAFEPDDQSDTSKTLVTTVDVEAVTNLETHEQTENDSVQESPSVSVTGSIPPPPPLPRVDRSPPRENKDALAEGNASTSNEGQVTPPEATTGPSSRGESTASSSEVDEGTIVNYNSVLASLTAVSLKRKNDASTEEESQKSDQKNNSEGTIKSIEDVKL